MIRALRHSGNISAISLSKRNVMEASIIQCIRRYDPGLTLKPKQRECLEHVYLYDSQKRDLIANLPVGYGKSLVYHVLPSLLSTKKSAVNGCVLVISPLNIIHADQMESLHLHGITSCRLDISGRMESEDGETSEYRLTTSSDLSDVRMGKFSVILCHPKALLNTGQGRSLMHDPSFQGHVLAVVIDECHIVEDWAKDFRTAFGRLKEVPATFPRVPFVALSGTLTTNQLKDLPEQLGLKNPVIVQESPDRPNIFLSKEEKVSGEGDVINIYEHIYKYECDELHKSPADYPVTLMFLPLRYTSCALRYLAHLFGQQDIYDAPYSAIYSTQDNVVIAETTKCLKEHNPRIRLVMATAAAGMGFDPVSVTRVIHASPPRSISKYLQEIGRAGRKGQQSEAKLFYRANDIAQNLPGIKQDIIDYFKSTTYLRDQMLSVFGFSKSDTIVSGCARCSVCKPACECSVCKNTSQ